MRAQTKETVAISCSARCAAILLLAFLLSWFIPRVSAYASEVQGESGIFESSAEGSFDPSHYGVDAGRVAEHGPSPLEDFEYSVDKDGSSTHVYWYGGTDPVVVVPAYIDGLPVTYITRGAFANNTDIQELYLPDTVTGCGMNAFEGLASLRAINIGSLTTVEMGRRIDLMWGCPSLERFTTSDAANLHIEHSGDMGKGLEILQADSIDSLKYIYIGSSMSEVGPELFYGDSLERVDVGAGNPLYSSHEGVVYSADGTKLVVMGSAYTGEHHVSEGCTSLGELAFDECSSVERIYIPESVTSVESSLAFAGCRATIVTPKGSYVHGYIESKGINNPIEFDGEAVNPVIVDLSKASVTVSPTSSDYDGTAKRPEVTVVLNGSTLVEGTDYSVSYGNNVNAGTAKVTISGMGIFEGEASATFLIEPLDLSRAEIGPIADQPYSGSKVAPELDVRVGSVVLTAGKDYTATYSNNVPVGTAEVTLMGRGNALGMASASFKIVPQSLEAATVSDIPAKTYSGEAIRPSVTVLLEGKRLTANTDYTLSYVNNVEVGTATVTVTGKGNYTGEVSVHFEIVAPEPPDPPQPSISFRDVTAATPHASDIMWLAESGVSTGWSEKDGSKTFRPTNTVIRQDMAAFLFRLAKLWGLVGDDWQPSGTVTFTDVSERTPHYREIMWLAESGVSAGWKVGNGREFRPTSTVVRQDMAAFLRRLQALRDPSVRDWQPTGASPFRDVTARTPHYDDILWLAESGVSAGWNVGGAKEFRPTSTVIRQDMAAFLHRLDGLG